ncbi:hypothetical protein MKW92_026253 [Papaver armeniacum]|nr:hypothetical protein MKW92_026253 [Papaver armeniacum]
MRVYKESLTTKYLFVFVLLTAVFGFARVHSETTLSNQQKLSKTITVDKSGKSDFSTQNWLKRPKSIILGEQVEIPSDKPFIVLEGESMNTTIIAWGDHDRLDRSPTFSCYADNFVARRVSFYVKHIQSSIEDTLWDVSGLHYFKSCFIEGAVDFIFGSAQSIYEDCDISVISEGLSIMKKDDAEEFVVVGFITAQGRDSPEDPSAFVFKGCRVFGTGKVYLGRAWRSHSTMLFYRSKLSDVVVPEGWDSWNYAGQDLKIEVKPMHLMHWLRGFRPKNGWVSQPCILFTVGFPVVIETQVTLDKYS